MKKKKEENSQAVEQENLQTTTEKQETFLDRFKKESSDLGDKIEKLSQFLHSENFGKIESNQRRLLKKQIGLMREYHAVLQERIKLLS